MTLTNCPRALPCQGYAGPPKGERILDLQCKSTYVGVQTPGKSKMPRPPSWLRAMPFLPRGVSDREAEGDLDSVGGLTWKRGGKQTFIVTPYRPYGARIDSTFLV